MRVVSSSFSTFYMFDQALQLERHGLLHRFIAGPPSHFAVKRGIPVAKIESLWLSFAIGYAQQLGKDFISQRMNGKMLRLAHDQFSRSLAKRLPTDADVFIGLSSYCYEAIIEANKRGIPAIVDHGSLHEEFERDVLMSDASKYGFRISGNTTHDWLIEKQKMEFENANFIFALSHLAKRTMIERGVDAGKIFVNHCGVSLKKFAPMKKADQVFRVIFCGSVCPRKGVHYLLQAFSELHLTNSELWVIGSTDGLRDNPNFEALLKKHSGPNVYFKGTVNGERLASMFSQGTVFVLPSLADGFGMVVTQAMACGLPVIVSESTGAADLVDEGENGFIVLTQDIEALKAKLFFMYENQDAAIEMGVSAKSAVAAGQTWGDYGERLANFLNGLPTTG
jgi:glycosyltransferase involved in cell wall biosynthesis